MLNGVGIRVVLFLGGLLLLAGCGNGPKLQTSGGSEPTLVTGSAAWQQTVPAEEYDARLAELTAAVERLRSQTSSGWVARQDDQTGYVGQLRGGTYIAERAADPQAVIAAFLDEYGTELLGVSSDDMTLPEEATQDAAGITSVRGQQTVGDVPVVDAVLTFAVSDPQAPRLTLVSGRVFGGVDVETEPDVTAAAAKRAAGDAVAGTAVDNDAEVSAQDDPELVVLPGQEGGSLAWRVIVVAGVGDGVTEVFIDAITGQVLRTRPGQINELSMLGKRGSGHTLRQGSPPAGEPVALTGQAPTGEELAATGTRTADGTIILRDTTTPWYDPATDTGAIEVYDAMGADDPSGEQLEPASSDDPRVTDSEALAALSYGRYLSDYYLQVFGHRAWDGEGGTLGAAVNVGGSDYCNAGFSAELTPAQMSYGSPCAPGGTPLHTSFVEIDVTGHEVTHGVIDRTGGLLYTGQSGAMNESLADYFGNVIGDAYGQRESATVGENGCQEVSGPTPLCEAQPDGSLGIRYMLNGSTMNDYLNLIDPPTRYRILGLTQDQGGVHLNSAVWNNALWTVRTRLARIDGVAANESVNARIFDQIVFAALQRYLTPTSSFFDGRVAIEQAAVDLGAAAVVQDTIREVFDLNAICPGCPDVSPTQALPVTTTSATQKSPNLGIDRLAWVDGGEFLFGEVAQSTLGGQPMSAAESTSTVSVGMAGNSVVSAEEGATGELQVLFRPEDGSPPTVLDTYDDQPFIDFIAGVAGSPEGAAWINVAENAVLFVDPQGQVTSAELPDAWGRQIEQSNAFNGFFSIATGGGTVAVTADSGPTFVWTPGQEPQVIEPLDGPVLSTAVHGKNLLAISVTGEDLGRFIPTGTAVLVDTESGQTQTLSQNAVALGAAVSGEYAVWPESVGALEGAVSEEEAEAGTEISDTDLHMYSLATGQAYSLMQQRGQQGFPSLSGNRLAWQDGVNGGDDIYTAVIPAGL